MTFKEIAKKYHTSLDSIDINSINKQVVEKGIDKFLSQQLIYCDCSRVVNGLRLIQTVGYPYTREISIYTYAVSLIDDYNKRKHYEDKLVELHNSNIEYEKTTTIWYKDKKQKENKHPRRKDYDNKTTNSSTKKPTAKESLNSKLINYANVKFKIKIKPND